MKKMLSVFLLGIFALIFPTSAEAKVIVQESGAYVVEADEVIDDDLFIGAESVEILGIVNGDVYVGTGNFIMNGEVTGDLFVGAGTVNISGLIGDDLWIGSGNVNIAKTNIGGGIMMGAGTVNIDNESSVGGSLLAGSGMFSNKAKVGRNIMIGAGNLNLDAPVGGEAMLGGESISLGSNTTIDGDLTYMVGEDQEIDLADGATVSGNTVRKESKHMDVDQEKMKKDFKTAYKAVWGGFQIMSFISALILGLLTLWLLPKAGLAVAQMMEKKPFESFGVGLLTVILAGPIFGILFMTVIGIPVALVLIPLFMLDLYFAKLATSYVLGRMATDYLGKKKVSAYAAYTLGLIVYFLLRVIPWVGPIVRALSLFIGLGAMYMTAFSWLKSQKKK